MRRDLYRYYVCGFLQKMAGYDVRPTASDAAKAPVIPTVPGSTGASTLFTPGKVIAPKAPPKPKPPKIDYPSDEEKADGKQPTAI